MGLRHDEPDPRANRLWDLYCRVVDNFGDVGVCWRLARDLAARGRTVRLFIDDGSALAWMAPGTVDRPAGVSVLPFDAPVEGTAPADVVIEAFGCDPPPARVQAMAAMAATSTTSGSPAAPVWINLEYLSAEPVVERLHGLPSPQPGGLRKWFFYPGFTAATGGLLREPALAAERAAFDRPAWLAAQGIAPAPGERLVSLFCYDNPAVPALLQALAQRPTLLLATPGAAQRLTTGLALPDGLRVQPLPWLSQPGYDDLLRGCDLNFVRGEDSLVRAHWARQPFVWQIYPQHDGVHADKLEALLARAALPAPVAALWRAWNGLGHVAPAAALGPALADDPRPWQAATAAWVDALEAQPDLTTQLLAFAAAHRDGLAPSPSESPPGQP